MKDLSDSRIERVTPETQGLKSILGNSFIEQDNINTIRKASDFKRANADTLLGDRRVPLRNISLFMGIVDGKLKVDSPRNFNDNDVIIPVWNKTELAKSLKRQTTGQQVNYSKLAKLWRESPQPDVPSEAVADSISKYDNLSSQSVGFTNSKGLFIPSSTLRRDKSLLVAPNGNSMFINNMEQLSPRQDSLVNAFLKQNGGAYPIQLDNGRYSHFLEGPDASYDRYMSTDLFRAPESVWVFGEVEDSL